MPGLARKETVPRRKLYKAGKRSLGGTPSSNVAGLCVWEGGRGGGCKVQEELRRQVCRRRRRADALYTREGP